MLSSRRPKRWPSRRKYSRGLGVHPDVLHELAHLGSIGDERYGRTPAQVGPLISYGLSST